MMRTAYVKGIANAQRVARAAVLHVAEGVKPEERGVQREARMSSALFGFPSGPAEVTSISPS
jgi:hypothetical protein